MNLITLLFCNHLEKLFSIQAAAKRQQRAEMEQTSETPMFELPGFNGGGARFLAIGPDDRDMVKVCSVTNYRHTKHFWDTFTK